MISLGKMEILSSYNLVSLHKRLFQTTAEHPFPWILLDEIWKKRLAGAGTDYRSSSWIPVSPAYGISNDSSKFFLFFICHRNSFIFNVFLLFPELEKKKKKPKKPRQTQKERNLNNWNFTILQTHHSDQKLKSCFVLLQCGNLSGKQKSPRKSP